MKYESIKEECCQANQRLPETGLVDLTFGNVSVLDPQLGVFAIKPSGVAYDQLTPAQMVVVDMEGETVEGDLRYSSDTPTHRRLFQAFADFGIRSIVHTHSRCAVAFAQAGQEIPCLGTTHADYFNGAVPITRPMTENEINGAYEWETGNVIVERYNQVDPLHIPSVLVNDHGPFSWGVSAAKALENAFALEVIADMALKTLSIKDQNQAIEQALLQKHFHRKHGKSAYYGQN
ncbi:MAG: L-ribulose-5-phosphate 4-epimerase AraD [Planctomycetota bacterium]